jgi:hypothetical protein
MKLVYVDDSNWDLYYDEDLKCVMSIPKQEARKQGCKESVFGSLKYTSNYLMNELKKDERKETKLTALGFKILTGKNIF